MNREQTELTGEQIILAFKHLIAYIIMCLGLYAPYQILEWLKELSR